MDACSRAIPARPTYDGLLTKGRRAGNATPGAARPAAGTTAFVVINPRKGPPMTRTRRARIALAAAVTGAALFAAVPSTASAGILVASAPNCDNGANSQPFAQWGDENHYFLAPGGSFEGNLGGWNLGGARAVADQEPWQVAEDDGL